jgi:hypothetical protein
MTEEQLRQLVIDALLKTGYSYVNIYLINDTVKNAIELAKEKGLLTSTDSEPIKSEWPNPAKVMWDKNEPYGAIKEETAHEQICAYSLEGGLCDCN